MKRIYLLLAVLCLTSLNLSAGNNAPDAEQAKLMEQQFEAGKQEAEAKVNQLSDRKKAKLKKKMEKLQAKHKAASDGVRVGLAILLVGAIIAILGLAGLGGLLITIGIIVLAVGLTLWLLSLLF